MTKKTLACALVAAAPILATQAADYYVSSSEGSDVNEGSLESPFATIDKAISSAGASDVIHVAAGSYQTTTEYGPNLTAKLVGMGASRADVEISSFGTYRTLRMAAGSWLENVTIVGEDTFKADKGGAIEMNGGTITNCVIRNGTAYGNSSKNAGGNLYVNNNSALVIDCDIYGGSVTNRGGNVCLDHGTVKNCTIRGGSSAAAEGSETFGGNVFIYQGKLLDCTVEDGSAGRAGNIYVYDDSTVSNCFVSGGTAAGTSSPAGHGGNIFMRNGTLIDSVVTNGTANASGGNVYIQAGNILSCNMGAGTVKNNEGGSVNMTGGAISNLYAVCNGSVKGSGGCVWMSAGTLMDSHLVGGTATGYYGGTLYMSGGTASDTVCEGGVTTRDGGNLYMTAGSATRMTIRNGKATNDGGNVRLKDGACVLSDSVIEDGIVVSSDKKGANVYMDGSASLIRCRLTGGTSEAGYGAGSICVYKSTATVEDCLIAECEVGGILAGSTAHVYNCTIVKNQKFGVWSWNKTQVFRNTVLFGNQNEGSVREWWGEQPVNEGSELLNCACEEDAISSTSFPSTYYITDSAFVDYANGDYRPVSGSRLIDHGVADNRTEASTTDLLGLSRLSGDIDIGCYEYQKTDLAVGLVFAEPLSDLTVPTTASFTANVQNADGDVTYTFSFGDGSMPLVTQESTVTHEYTTPGVYTVKVVASDSNSTAEMIREDFVSVYDTFVCVDPNGSSTFPYNTAETALRTIPDALALTLSDYDIRLLPGVHESAGQMTVSKAVRILGQGSKPEAVVIRNTKMLDEGTGQVYNRIFELNGSGILLANVTLENGRVRNGYGANLRVVSGVVSNCIIRGGLALRSKAEGASGSVNAAGGGLEVGSNARVCHCVVSNNTVRGTSDQNYTGGAIFLPYGSQNAVLSNLLIANNTYEADAEGRNGAAGVYYGGSNDSVILENCTVVSNTVVGALKDDSAGVYCTSWNARFRNNVIAGNYETDKERMTSVVIETHCTVDYCITDDQTPYNSNCFVATLGDMFADFASGNYRPKSSGALCDRGNPSQRWVTGLDVQGRPRVFGKGIDLGCYENQITPGFRMIIR